MVDYKLTNAEEKLADIIWSNEPVKSSELVKICEVNFKWKKSTTYTMLKRLESKDIFKNENSAITALVNKEDFSAEQSKIFVNENFGGSLPKFLVAFTRKNKLGDKEIREIQELIDGYRETLIRLRESPKPYNIYFLPLYMILTKSPIQEAPPAHGLLN